MGINGTKGRATVLRRIRREREAEARAAGVDPSDRAAFHEWDQKRSLSFWEGLRARVAAIEPLHNRD